MRAVSSVSLPEPLAAELNRLVTETDRSKSDIVKESVSQYLQYLWEARFCGVRRQLIRRAKRTGVTAEADLFRAVS
jgi:Arc/MetJ-type ribon-helix-helix transcriptional regulator